MGTRERCQPRWPVKPDTVATTRHRDNPQCRRTVQGTPPRCNDSRTRRTSPSTAWRALFTATCRPCWSAGSDRCSFRCSIPTPWPASPNIRATAKTPSGDSSRRRTSSASRPTARGPRPTRRLNGSSPCTKSFVVSPTTASLLRANDPHLLAWVHAARDLDVPHGLPTLRRGAIERRRRRSLTCSKWRTWLSTWHGRSANIGGALEATIPAIPAELRLSPDGATARDFVVHGVQRGPIQRSVNWLLVRCSFASDTLGIGAPRREAPTVAQPALHRASDGVTVSAAALFVPPPPR